MVSTSSAGRTKRASSVACSSDLTRCLDRLRGIGLELTKSNAKRKLIQCNGQAILPDVIRLFIKPAGGTQQARRGLFPTLVRQLQALPAAEFTKLSQFKTIWYLDYVGEPIFLDLNAMRAYPLSAFNTAIGHARIVYSESSTAVQEEVVVLEEHQVVASPTIQLPSTFEDLKQAAHWAMLNYSTTEMDEVQLNHVFWSSNDVVPLNTQLATLLQYERELLVRTDNVQAQTYKPSLALLQQLVDADINTLRDVELVQLVDNIIPNLPDPKWIIAHNNESRALSTITSLVQHERMRLETILHTAIESRAHEIALFAVHHLAIVDGAAELAGALVSHLKALQASENGYHPFKCRDCQKPVLKLDFVVSSHCQQCQHRCAVCRIKVLHEQLASPENAHFLLPEEVAVMSHEARLAHQCTHEFIALANKRCICDPTATAAATTNHERMPADAPNLMETENLTFFSPYDYADAFLNLRE